MRNKQIKMRGGGMGMGMGMGGGGGGRGGGGRGGGMSADFAHGVKSEGALCATTTASATIM